MLNVKQKSPAMVLLLNIVTCGIYSYYWMYATTEDLQKISPNAKLPSGIVALLLNLVTCGFYSIYWYYVVANAIQVGSTSRGMQSPVSPSKYIMIYLVGIVLICCFWVGLIIFPLIPMFIQGDINNLIATIQQEQGYGQIEEQNDFIQY